MEHGTFITEGMSDWQIVQHHDGYATVHFAGTWIVIKDAVKIGIVDVVPKIRIVSEEDNSQISAWLTPSYTPDNDDMKTGTWETDLKIPGRWLLTELRQAFMLKVSAKVSTGYSEVM